MKEVNSYESEFKGLQILVCPECGKTSVIHTKEVRQSYRCNGCGVDVDLSNDKPIPVRATCECGNKMYASTNCKDKILSFNCRCGYPLDAEYSKHKNKYFGIR
jgi:predicted RNA-binding Zn-ribbon protein involved in translation (DUF1610 family)